MRILKEELEKVDRVKIFIGDLKRRIENESGIILFGAGMGGQRFWNWLSSDVNNGIDKVKCFVDNNKLKWGEIFPYYGVEVVSPDRFMKEYAGELICITCGEGDVITEQILETGRVPRERIIIPDTSAIDISGKDYEYIWSNIESFESVFNVLADDKSKNVFRDILNYKIMHDITLIEKNYDNYEMQYFDEELIKYSDKDVFVDCGGYIGDTIESYIEKNKGNYKKVISFEADEENYKIMKSKFDSNNKIEIINAACWNKKCELYFDNIGSGSGNISDEGQILVNAVRIDDVVSSDKVSFIKMDIEGAEYEALLGAYECIRTWHPVLQISVYHKKEDFVRIPLLIKSMYENYELYFRHYRKTSVQETVCYAIPKQL